MSENIHIFTDATTGKEKVVNLDDIRKAFKNNHKIGLIKEYRDITKKGLKDSKDAVEEAMKQGEDAVVQLFRSILGVDEPYSKEEFMSVIENAIDNMESLYYTDMLSAVMSTLDNIKKLGGLQYLARERNRFINNI